MVLKIRIPPNFISERIYAIDIILGEFLGLDYEIVVSHDIGHYEIIIENKKKLIAKDCFFRGIEDSPDYLKEKNIPPKIKFIKNQFLVEEDIPVIYGDEGLSVSDDNIVCGIDIFASVFFMLTRWEEYANKIRDKYNRFPASGSLAYKNGFLGRPVVDEYVEMLWNMLVKLGINQKRRENRFEMVLTHDVDSPLKYGGWQSGLKEIAEKIVRRRSFSQALSDSVKKFRVHLGIDGDPFDTFDYLMSLSEQNGIKSHFFFMARSNYRTNTKFIQKLTREIRKRGHLIGMHPGYNSYINPNQWRNEKKEIEQYCGQKIIFGRQHCLRFEVPITWQIWEDNNMEWDSTLSYADKEGFRCGVCRPFTVFNIFTRKKLKLKERPLVVMEGSLINYQPNISSEEVLGRIRELVSKIKRYKGEFVLLWHNSNFNSGIWVKYRDVYKEILEYSH